MAQWEEMILLWSPLLLDTVVEEGEKFSEEVSRSGFSVRTFLTLSYLDTYIPHLYFIIQDKFAAYNEAILAIAVTGQSFSSLRKKCFAVEVKFFSLLVLLSKKLFFA